MMVQNQPELRAKELRELINRYSYEYHILDKPSVSNAIWDSLLAELKKIEEKYPEYITSDSPTQRVGSALTGGFKKVKHSKRMISLNDVFDKSEVEAWAKRMDNLLIGQKHEFFADIKMDGLACAIIYQDGLFSRAITRGDGFIGEDITENVRTIKNVPLRLVKNPGFERFLIGRTEIRGEIVMLKSDFEKLNKKQISLGLPEFANPRNLAAGTVRQLDPSVVVSRPLSFRAYDLLRDDSSEIKTWMEAYQIATALGITRNMQACVFNDLNKVMKFVEEWDKKRDDLPFWTDGLVVKVNNREQYDSLGEVGKTVRAAVAYKYAPEKVTAVISDIVISIGRTGAATPVAVFSPIVVAGSTVQHASLHNADEISRLDVRIGDTVVVYKAGDIIPQVESVIKDLRPKDSIKYDFEKMLKTQYPELKFERPEGEAVYRVKGESGPIILKRALQHFASKGAMDIDTLGDKNVDVLVDNNLVKDLADIYNLTFDQIVRLDRFADISAHKLIDAILSTKNPSLQRFIFGLGIRHVGAQTANDLAKYFKSIDALSTASIEQLREVDGIGEVVAESIIAWFSDDDNNKLLEKFSELGVAPIFQETSGKLLGNTFAITGTLQTMSRDEAAEKIRSLGGIFQTAVALDTKYLVVGENTGNSKIVKAKKYGTKIINEQDLIKILED